MPPEDLSSKKLFGLFDINTLLAAAFIAGVTYSAMASDLKDAEQDKKDTDKKIEKIDNKIGKISENQSAILATQKANSQAISNIEKSMRDIQSYLLEKDK